MRNPRSVDSKRCCEKRISMLNARGSRRLWLACACGAHEKMTQLVALDYYFELLPVGKALIAFSAFCRRASSSRLCLS